LHARGQSRDQRIPHRTQLFAIDDLGMGNRQPHEIDGGDGASFSVEVREPNAHRIVAIEDDAQPFGHQHFGAHGMHQEQQNQEDTARHLA
jgi:hypothetical protein